MCQAWVTDTATTERLLPIGTVGEIVIQGPNVGRGYMNSLAKAQSGFIDSPSWSSKITKNMSGRFYRTGDLGRLNHDGSFTIVGRKDDQVKLRGQRIEVHEVEYHINKSPVIQEAIVVVPVEGPFKQRLLALVRLKEAPGSEGSCNELQLLEGLARKASAAPLIARARSHMEKEVPRHMVPTLWIPVQNFPRLTSGKTDRGAISRWVNNHDLPHDIGFEHFSQSANFSPPTSKVEATLQSIWSDILKIPRDMIGVDQSFFTIGGDSVLAIQMITKARTEGLVITARQIFEHQKISAIALDCNRTDTAGLVNRYETLGIDQDLPIDELNIDQLESRYPLSPMQESILNAQENGANLWHASFLFELQSPQSCGKVDPERFMEAWQKVVDRHPILRTIFGKDEEGNRHQTVLRDYAAPMELLSGPLPPDYTTIQGEESPPHRLVLSQNSDGKLLAQFHLSHSLYDGVSLNLIWNDLQALYTNGQYKRPSPPYHHFITYLGKRERSRSADYWKTRFNGIDPCNFPSEGIVPGNNHSFEETTARIERLPRIKEFCQRRGVTFGCLFQAAWALVLRYYCGHNHVSFGYMVSGRDAPIDNVDEICGPLINLLPCVIRIPKATLVSALFETLQLDLADSLTVSQQLLSFYTYCLTLIAPKLFVGRYTASGLVGYTLVQDVSQYPALRGTVSI